MDVKSVFFHGDLVEEIYMEQPPSFVTDSTLVCQLKKSLQGLKQAPRAWYEKIDRFFFNLGFKRCESNHSIYVLHADGNTLIVVVYVDDLVLTSNTVDLFSRLKHQLVDTFEMTYLGILHFFLGLQVLPLSDGLFVSQSKYLMDLLKRFKMDDYKACATPYQSGVKLTNDCEPPKVDATLYRQLVGSLVYLIHSRSDISFAVSVVSRFMQAPRESHCKVVKCIIHYLKGTSHFGIKYGQSTDSLVDYTDSNQDGDGDDQKSTSGFVFHFSDGPLVWSSKKQKVVSLSTIEAEHRGVVNASTKVVWIRQLLGELRFPIEASTVLCCDNQSAIQVRSSYCTQ